MTMPLTTNTHQEPLLAIQALNIVFHTPEGDITAVHNLEFTLQVGETLGIVGESGSGKSQTAFSLMGLLADNSDVQGSIRFQGKELLTLSEKEWNQIRAQQIAIIFQDPMTSLNPYIPIGTQLVEVLLIHTKMSKKEAFNEAVSMLSRVKIPDPESRMFMYPHECSGGMRQRIMIAMALLCRPKILIADEPTTALDVTVQAQIIELLNELKSEFQTSIILITHDLGVVAGTCDKVLVMYAGQTMEYGSTAEIFQNPSHPYTIGLLKAIPRLDSSSDDELLTIPGDPPNLLHLPTGCPFSPRCAYKMEICTAKEPSLTLFGNARLRACFKAQEELT